MNPPKGTTLGPLGTPRLRKGSRAFWGKVWAFGAVVWDISTRVQEPYVGQSGSYGLGIRVLGF